MIKYVKGESKGTAPAKSTLPTPSNIGITIKKNKGITKFKVRTAKYLLTLKVDNKEKADRIMQAIPPSTRSVNVRSQQGHHREEEKEVRIIPSHILIHTSNLIHHLSPHLSLIHICRCRRIERCRSRWSPYH
eukprot:TRINITY_DN3284_c0_g1_i8.p2 TRINITY_DN3284_c0_g1~~TRINITY_DN3284_c0_g1_i8.p2  ORF type:complete len:132 (-),score=30.78 TRINITY_DN3284_c0_g1_i8:20-415(-)